MKLYELTEQYQNILDRMNDCDAEEFDRLNDELLSTDAQLHDKAEAYCKMVRIFEAEEEAYRIEEERLRNHRQSAAHKAERLKRTLESELLKLDMRDIQAGTFKVKIQLNNPSVNVTDETAIPSDYFIPQPPKLDKKLMLEEMKAGVVIPGAEIQRTESIRIR